MRQMTIKEVQARQLSLMKTLHTYLGEKKIPYYLLAGSVLGAVRHGGFIPWDDDIDVGLFRPDYERFLSVCQDFDRRYEVAHYRRTAPCDFCLTRIYFPDTRIDDPSLRRTRLDNRLYLDIFPLDNMPDDPAERERFARRIRRKKARLAAMDARDYRNPAYILLLKQLRAACLSPFRGKLLADCDRTMQAYRDRDTDCVCSLCSQYSASKQTMPRAFYGTPTLHPFADTAFYLPEQADAYLRHLYGPDYLAVPPENKRRKGYPIFLLHED